MDINDDDIPDLPAEMSTNQEIIKLLENRDVAVEFYSALCNMKWRKRVDKPEDELIVDALKGVENSDWHCSWRYAGGIIARIRRDNYGIKEDYMDFYCSGNEGDVSPLVKETFGKIGWEPIEW